MSLPRGLQKLFHNVDPASVDPERDASLVIRTVLGSGSWEQVLWLFRRYGVERVREEVRADVEGFRTLPEPTRALWSLVLLEPEEGDEGSLHEVREDPLERWSIRRIPPRE